MCDSASKTREGNRENSKKEDLINKNGKLDRTCWELKKYWDGWQQTHIDDHRCTILGNQHSLHTMIEQYLLLPAFPFPVLLVHFPCHLLWMLMNLHDTPTLWVANLFARKNINPPWASMGIQTTRSQPKVQSCATSVGSVRRKPRSTDAGMQKYNPLSVGGNGILAVHFQRPWIIFWPPRWRKDILSHLFRIYVSTVCFILGPPAGAPGLWGQISPSPRQQQIGTTGTHSM